MTESNAPSASREGRSGLAVAVCVPAVVTGLAALPLVFTSREGAGFTAWLVVVLMVAAPVVKSRVRLSS